MVAERVVNIVTYMPVAVATIGWSPIITRIGEKMNPGPTPQKAANIDPTKAMPISIIKFFWVA